MVVIAGKGHEPYQELIGDTIEQFDDRAGGARGARRRSGRTREAPPAAQTSRGAVDGLLTGADVEITLGGDRLACRRRRAACSWRCPASAPTAGCSCRRRSTHGAAGALVRDGADCAGTGGVRPLDRAMRSSQLAADERRHDDRPASWASRAPTARPRPRTWPRRSCSTTLRTHASPGSFNNEVGLPVTLLGARARTSRSWSPSWARVARVTSRCCARSPVPTSWWSPTSGSRTWRSSGRGRRSSRPRPNRSMRSRPTASPCSTPTIRWWPASPDGVAGRVVTFGTAPERRRARGGRVARWIRTACAAFTIVTDGEDRVPVRLAVARRAHGLERARGRGGRPGARRLARASRPNALADAPRLAVAHGDVHHRRAGSGS